MLHWLVHTFFAPDAGGRGGRRCGTATQPKTCIGIFVSIFWVYPKLLEIEILLGGVLLLRNNFTFVSRRTVNGSPNLGDEKYSSLTQKNPHQEAVSMTQAPARHKRTTYK